MLLTPNLDFQGYPDECATFEWRFYWDNRTGYGMRYCRHAVSGYHYRLNEYARSCAIVFGMTGKRTARLRGCSRGLTLVYSGVLAVVYPDFALSRCDAFVYNLTLSNFR